MLSEFLHEVFALLISNSFNYSLIVVGLLVTATIASLTIGGKAIGKSIAINNSNVILFRFAKFISYFHK